MDRYVRQNIAEIDEIVAEEHVEKILLTPAERAVYLELDHHLQVGFSTGRDFLVPWDTGTEGPSLSRDNRTSLKSYHGTGRDSLSKFGSGRGTG